jgi:integrase/recombinase XerD
MGTVRPFKKTKDEARELVDLDASSKAEGTARHYQFAFQQLEKWCDGIGVSFADLTPLQAAEFIASESKRAGAPNPVSGKRGKLCRATVYNRITLLRHGFQTLVDAGLIEHNPFDNLMVNYKHHTAGQVRPTEMLPFGQVQRLLEGPDNRTRRGIRDRTYFYLLFGCGLRNGEVAALRVGDVQASPEDVPYLLLQKTKAGKAERQPLPEWVSEQVAQQVTMRKRDGAKNGSPLLVEFWADGRPKDTQMNTTSLAKILKWWVQELQIPGRVSPHSARATAITKMLSEGFTYREVQEFARHSSIKMTEHYDKRRFGLVDHPGRRMTKYEGGFTK